MYMCVCVCVCVCGDSLQRKSDMCWITRDIEDGWLFRVGKLAQRRHQHKHTAINPETLNMEESTEGALDFNTASHKKDTSEVKLTC